MYHFFSGRNTRKPSTSCLPQTTAKGERETLSQSRERWRSRRCLYRRDKGIKCGKGAIWYPFSTLLYTQYRTRQTFERWECGESGECGDKRWPADYRHSHCCAVTLLALRSTGAAIDWVDSVWSYSQLQIEAANVWRINHACFVPPFSF